MLSDSKSHPWDTTHEMSKKSKLREPAKRKHFDLIDEGRASTRLRSWEVEKQKTYLWFRAMAMKWLEAVPMHDDTTFLWTNEISPKNKYNYIS